MLYQAQYKNKFKLLITLSKLQDSELISAYFNVWGGGIAIFIFFVPTFDLKSVAELKVLFLIHTRIIRCTMKQLKLIEVATKTVNANGAIWMNR